jgi:hypothetical protein
VPREEQVKHKEGKWERGTHSLINKRGIGKNIEREQVRGTHSLKRAKGETIENKKRKQLSESTHSLKSAKGDTSKNMEKK